MRYLLRTDGIEFEVSKRPVPKTTANGAQKVDSTTGWPVWSVELTGFATEEEGTTVLTVNVPAPQMPELQWREPVEVVDLEMIPWAQKDRDGDIRKGVSFRAREIRPLRSSEQVASAA
jgi:hypothetical protein